MKEFALEHPWLTLILGLAAVNGVVTLVRGYDPSIGALASTAEKPKTAPGSATAAVAGWFGADHHVRSDAGRAVDRTANWLLGA